MNASDLRFPVLALSDTVTVYLSEMALTTTYTLLLRGGWLERQVLFDMTARSWGVAHWKVQHGVGPFFGYTLSLGRRVRLSLCLEERSPTLSLQALQNRVSALISASGSELLPGEGAAVRHAVSQAHTIPELIQSLVAKGPSLIAAATEELQSAAGREGSVRNFLRKLGRPARELRHELFGTLKFSKHDGWMSNAFALWGFTGIELIVDAGSAGPSPQQAEAFRRFLDAKEALLPRCLRAVDAVREGLGAPSGEFRISGLTIPSLASGPASRTWTLWFDLAGDDHYMYGVETDDDWESLGAFADD